MLGITALSKRVEEASGRTVSWQKSVVGEGVFTHEAGIHVDGLLKDINNYQGLDPAIIGREHQLILGKHSGTSMLRKAYKQLNIELYEWQEPILLAKVRQFVNHLKRCPNERELKDLLFAANYPESRYGVNA